MLNTEKEICRMLATALARYGCRYAVVSPGTRSAPLVMALHRQEQITCQAVIDERSAAFIALGRAQVSREPVALVCTSGTALLNYAPAVAEAYYTLTPLIVISADRPAAMIDQDDSQTIRQPGALANITVGSCALRGEAASDEQRWVANRTLNHILTVALQGPRRGPVHINIHLSEPLTRQAMVGESFPFRKISLVAPPEVISVEQARELAAETLDARVLVVAGFQQPQAAVSKALAQMAVIPNVAVVAEPVANLHAAEPTTFHTVPDDLLSALNAEGRAALRPQILITTGGALVSRQLKEFLRGVGKPLEHWHVGRNHMTIDTYQALTRRVEIPAEGFFPRLAGAMGHLQRVKSTTASTLGSVCADDYAQLWQHAEDKARRLRQRFYEVAPWCDLTAVHRLVEALPADYNLRLGNGMTLRYALLNDLQRFHRVDGNRGVSGIDGCTSTALGASTAYAKPTVLLTGDMGAQYDMAALAASGLLLARMKIIVMANGDGSIFRVIKPTAQLPETDAYIAVAVNLPLRQLAAAYGFRYLRATSFPTLARAMRQLVEETEKPVILEVVTDSRESAAVARTYFNRLKLTKF